MTIQTLNNGDTTGPFRGKINSNFTELNGQVTEEVDRLYNAPSAVGTFSNNYVELDALVEAGKRIRISILLTSQLNNGASTVFTIQAFNGETYLENIVSNQSVTKDVEFTVDYTNSTNPVTKFNFYCGSFGGDVTLKATTTETNKTRLGILEKSTLRKDKIIVLYGTSVPAGTQTVVTINGITSKNNYPKMLEKLLGCIVLNEAIGGTRISTGDPSSYNITTDPLGIGNQANNSFGFYSSIGHTIAEKDWIFDNWASIYTKFTDFAGLNATCPKTKAELEAYSFETKLIDKYLTTNATVCNPDLFVIDHGFNDMWKIIIGSGNTMPVAYSATERMYYWGAMNYFIRKIYAAHPKARIVMISHYRKGEPDLDNLYNTMKSVANYWQIPIIDLAYNLQTASIMVDVAGYWDNTGIWHDTGYTFVDNGNSTFTTNDYGPQRSYSYASYMSIVLPHQVVADEELSLIYPVGTWVRKEHRLNLLCKDNVHPHSDASGLSNLQIAQILAKELPKYL